MENSWKSGHFLNGVPELFYLRVEEPPEPAQGVDAQQLLQAVLTEAQLAPPLGAIQPGLPCAVNIGATFERAVVDQVDEEGNVVLVQLVDAGGMRRVKRADVRKMPISVAHVPPRAIACKLDCGNKGELPPVLFQGFLSEGTEILFQPQEAELENGADVLTVKLKCWMEMSSLVSALERAGAGKDATETEPVKHDQECQTSTSSPRFEKARVLRCRGHELRTGQPFQALVLHVQSKDFFHIVPLDELSLSEEAMQMQPGLAAFYGSKPDLEPVSEDLVSAEAPLAIRHLEDDQESWFRGELLSQISSNTFSIVLVDSGEVKKVERRDVFPLAQEFSAMPKLYIRCSLKGSQVDSLTTDQEMTFVPEEMSASGTLIVCLEEARKEDLSASEEGPIPWNPMKSAFETPSLEEHPMMGVKPQRGGFALDDEDDSLSEEDLDAGNEVKLCRFYSETGHCSRKPKCPDLHKYTGAPVTADEHCGYMLTVAGNEVDRPKENSVVLVKVTSVIHPGNFFCILPQGSIDIKEVEPTQMEQDEDEDLDSLSYELNEFYRNTSMPTGEDLKLQSGQIIAAKWEDGQWYRARFICQRQDSTDDESELTDSDLYSGDLFLNVFLVDYGCSEIVPWSRVRSLEVRFLKLPFQAINCCLAGAAPADGQRWSDAAVDEFHSLTRKRDLMASVVLVEEEMHVELFSMDMESVTEKLIERKLVSKMEIQKKRPMFGPG